MIKPILENRLSEIESLLADVDEVCLAIAYVRNSGVRMLRPTYLQSKAKFRIIVDTNQRLTDKRGLEQLLNDRFSLKKFTGNVIYHPKVWLFRKDNEWKVVVGSMNMSSPALNSSVEACVLISGQEVTQYKDWFDALWNDNTRTQKLDFKIINSLPSISNVSILEELPRELQIDISRVKKPAYSKKDILDFIKDWSHDTVRVSPGPLLRKTGWIFRPAHGDMNQPTFEELQRILKAMFGISSLSFRLSEISATNVLKKARVQYRRLTHKTSDRERLMKQQINYLSKLALIEKRPGCTNWDIVNLTALGRAYINSASNRLIDFVESAIMRHKWFGVNIYEFTKAVLLLLEGNKITYDEFFIFLRHGGILSYSFHIPEDIAKLILAYRKIGQPNQKYIWDRMELWINANDLSPSKTSLANMKKNWAPGIFRDLGICKEFTIRNNYLCLNI